MHAPFSVCIRTHKNVRTLKILLSMSRQGSVDYGNTKITSMHLCSLPQKTECGCSSGGGISSSFSSFASLTCPHQSLGRRQQFSGDPLGCPRALSAGLSLLAMPRSPHSVVHTSLLDEGSSFPETLWAAVELCLQGCGLLAMSLLA